MKLGRIGGVVLVALVFAAAGAQSASASTTIGQLGTVDNVFACSQGVQLQLSVSSGNGYTVTAGGGVLTSFSNQTSSDPNQAASFKVFSKQGDLQFTVVGTTPFVSLRSSTLETIPARIPVSGGEVIGMYTSDSAGDSCSFSGGENAGGFALEEPYLAGDPQPGSSVTINGQGNARLDVQATIEPDADHDGYGDETQDLCPTNASTHAACPGSQTTSGTLVTAPIEVVPNLGSFGFSSTVFRAAPSGAAFSSKRAPVGTKVSFSVSEASSVKFTVQRKTRGRKVGRTCKTATHANRKKKACTLWKAVKGSFTVQARQGKNAFTFRGRIGGKALKPGSYRLSGAATTARKLTSKPGRKAFKIVK
jgi:hypothetical protein